MKNYAKEHEGDKKGVDISLIKSNLRLTPVERLRRNDRVLSTAKKMRQAMEQKRNG